MHLDTLRHLVLALPLAVLGCQGVDSAPPAADATTASQELASAYGGQTTSDEAPAFGDPALQTAPMAEDDPSAGDTTSPDAPELAGAARLRILVAWGYVQPHPDATEVVDWSGAITVANGALRVVRAVRFEPATDMVIRPRTDLHTVAFTSKTRPAADGLLLEVFTGPKLNPTNGTVTLTFASAPITNTQTLVPGERLSAVVPVDDAGHVLVYHVVRPDGGACHEGFMRGQWQVVSGLPAGEVGVLRGRISSGDGALRGHLKGVFGARKDGKRLFFAKVIDDSGAFRALLAGAYADGVFRGRILVGPDVQHLTIAGRVHGRYFDADPSAAAGDGAFIGRWSQSCGEDPDEGQPPASDAQPPGEDGDAATM